MELITPTTKLEAVNQILATIGESPVATLTDDFVDAQIAQDYIDQEVRRVQSQSWSFNTDYDYVLTPDVNNEIPIPANALRVTSKYERKYIVRENKLYDRELRTYVFADPVTVDVVWAFEFEALPELLRQFIMIRAARRFQDVTEADPGLHRFTQQDELMSWAAFLDHEASVARYNLALDSSTVFRIRGRYRHA